MGEPLATRHYCTSSLDSFGSHTRGDGTPRRKRCAYCGGTLTAQRGWWGVFVHSSVSGDARYRPEDAISLHAREKQAERKVSHDTTGTWVVRWIGA